MDSSFPLFRALLDNALYENISSYANRMYNVSAVENLMSLKPPLYQGPSADTLELYIQVQYKHNLFSGYTISRSMQHIPHHHFQQRHVGMNSAKSTNPIPQ
ncbi:hypothetical protein [Paenibacillus sp. Z3-2]